MRNNNVVARLHDWGHWFFKYQSLLWRHLAKELPTSLPSKSPEESLCQRIVQRGGTGRSNLQSVFTTYLRRTWSLHSQVLWGSNYTVEFGQKKSSTSLLRNPLRIASEQFEYFYCGKSIDPHKHQKEAILHGMNTNRCLLLSPTGSGNFDHLYASETLFNLIQRNKVWLLFRLSDSFHKCFRHLRLRERYKMESKRTDAHGCWKEKNTKKRVVISTCSHYTNYHQNTFSSLEQSLATKHNCSSRSRWVQLWPNLPVARIVLQRQEPRRKLITN